MRASVAGSLAMLLLCPIAPTGAEDQSKKKLEFQYSSGEIQIPIPTADEPKVERFGADSVRAAARYLDEGAIAWTREKGCIACHTTGAYLLARPMLTQQLGKPNEEVLAEFIRTIPEEVPATREESGVTYAPLVERAVWRTAALVQWDKHVTGKVSEHTDRALQNLLMQQSSHGGFYARGEVEIPYVTTDFELTLHAVRALVDAPGWLATVTDPELLARIDRLKTFLRETEPRNDYERVLRIELATLLPELVTPDVRAASIDLLLSKQRPDGGWSTRSMSDTENWRTPMSDTVVNLIRSLPDAADPESDAYMTAFAIMLLRQSGVPADDERIRRGIAWLKREQRASGRWWMHSLYRGNYHFTTYIATAKAMQALAMCDELPTL